MYIAHNIICKEINQKHKQNILNGLAIIILFLLLLGAAAAVFARYFLCYMNYMNLNIFLFFLTIKPKSAESHTGQEDQSPDRPPSSQPEASATPANQTPDDSTPPANQTEEPAANQELKSESPAVSPEKDAEEAKEEQPTEAADEVIEIQ